MISIERLGRSHGGSPRRLGAVARRTLATTLVTVAAIVGLGCGLGQDRDAACEALLGEIPVQYVGHAFGRGTLELRRDGVAPSAVAGHMALGERSGQKSALRLTAVGTCRHGVARLRFGAADTPASVSRVLGGRLVVVHESELLGGTFGMWKAETVDKRTGERKQPHGYLRALEPGEAEQVAVHGPVRVR